MIGSQKVILQRGNHMQKMQPTNATKRIKKAKTTYPNISRQTGKGKSFAEIYLGWGYVTSQKGIYLLYVSFTIFLVEARWRVEAASNVPSSQRGGLRRFRPGDQDVTTLNGEGWGRGICHEGCADVTLVWRKMWMEICLFWQDFIHLPAVEGSIAMLDSYMMLLLKTAMPLFSTLISDHHILFFPWVQLHSSPDNSFFGSSLTSPRASSLSFCLGHSGRMGDGNHVPWSKLVVATLPTKLRVVSDVT